MRHVILIALTLIACSAFPERAAAHRFGHPTVPLNEFQFGMGWAVPSENAMFNIEFDVGLESDFAYHFLFYHNTSDQLAFGLHFLWTHQDTEPLTVEDIETQELFDLVFHVDSYSLGPRARYTLARGTLSPYVYVGMSYSFGSAESILPDLRYLGYDGFTGTGGIGTSILAAAWLDISVEAFGIVGGASWDRPPFVNSTSRSFDPSMYGFLGNVTLRF